MENGLNGLWDIDDPWKTHHLYTIFFSINLPLCLLFKLGWIWGYGIHGLKGITLGLEHLWILVSTMGPEANPPWIKGLCPYDRILFSNKNECSSDKFYNINFKKHYK